MRVSSCVMVFAPEDERKKARHESLSDVKQSLHLILPAGVVGPRHFPLLFPLVRNNSDTRQWDTVPMLSIHFRYGTDVVLCNLCCRSSHTFAEVEVLQQNGLLFITLVSR